MAPGELFSCWVRTLLAQARGYLWLQTAGAPGALRHRPSPTTGRGEGVLTRGLSRKTQQGFADAEAAQPGEWAHAGRRAEPATSPRLQLVPAAPSVPPRGVLAAVGRLKPELTSTSLYCFLNKLPLPWRNIVL